MTSSIEPDQNFLRAFTVHVSIEKNFFKFLEYSKCSKILNTSWLATKKVKTNRADPDQIASAILACIL